MAEGTKAPLSQGRLCKLQLASLPGLWKTFVKYRNFAQEFGCGKNHKSRKSKDFVISCNFCLCKSKMYTQRRPHLWKTLVENSVESVENCEFSTVISAPCPWGPSCGKLCISPCIKGLRTRVKGCYVADLFRPGFDQFDRKSWKSPGKCCHNPAALFYASKFFVKMPQRIFWYHLSFPGNTSLITFFQEEHHAGKSRDLRREHIQINGFVPGGDGHAAAPGPGGRRSRPGKTH